MKTTIEIASPLLAKAKRVAAREKMTLRELVEGALRRELGLRAEGKVEFVPRDARVDGAGLQGDFQGAGWDAIRDAAYEGRGS